MSSVAMIVKCRFFARDSSVPRHVEAMVCPHNKVVSREIQDESQRAGMRTTALFTLRCHPRAAQTARIPVVRRPVDVLASPPTFFRLHCRYGTSSEYPSLPVFRHPIGRVGGVEPKTGADANRLIPALCPQWTSISLSPTKTEDARSSRFPCTLQNHSGRRLATFGLERRGHAGTKIGGVISGSPICRSTSACTASYCSRVKQPRQPCFGFVAGDQFESSRL